MRRCLLTTLAATAPAVVVAVTWSAGAGTAAATGPACFGAAARDAQNRCINPTLSVFPTVQAVDADYVAGSACDPVPGNPAPICAFGVAQSKARRQFALLGDSHALHWRRAVDVVALAERWRGYSMTTAACPFSAAVDRLPQGLRAQCQAWYRSAMAWLKDHPEVSTVFTSSFAPLPVEVKGSRAVGARRSLTSSSPGIGAHGRRCRGA